MGGNNDIDKQTQSLFTPEPSFGGQGGLTPMLFLETGAAMKIYKTMERRHRCSSLIRC